MKDNPYKDGAGCLLDLALLIISIYTIWFCLIPWCIDQDKDWHPFTLKVEIVNSK
jgi:hypothetical protein